MNPLKFHPGDRCSTSTLGNDTIQPPLWVMPCHHLIQFDSGPLLWMPREILQQPMVVQQTRQRRQRRRKAA